ncbi:MAG: hypothetical protein IKE22_04535 [Atopobiaceae bacterium]|nr:hypothetical protein [Atopobiaceae bacterium]
MERQLIWNDWKGNRLVTAATICFMAVSAALMGLSLLLSATLLTSIDRLMETAATPDFLQMHGGELDDDELVQFATSRSDVAQMQTAGFLNLENGELSLGTHSLADNTQDNGLCVQNESFDFLMDLDGNVIRVSPGEVYVPVCYRGEYDAKVGEALRIGTQELTIAGFLRDSQMNSMMASSKRFLVHERDYARLKALGKEEYLIEFQLHDGADINAFATAYSDAGLPSNGPTITRPLIRLINALSDGMMILVILLVSFVILGISILCIRAILLTSLEKDKREIGMMKAVGIPRADIRNLYFSKFLALSILGAVLGEVSALLVSTPLCEQMRELYGLPEHMTGIWMLSVVGILAVEAMIMLSVCRTLRFTESMTAVDALRGTGGPGKEKNRYLFVLVITAATTGLMLVPLSIASTLSSPRFVSYMGIGSSQIRIDIRQAEHVDTVSRAILSELEGDPSVEGAVSMETRSYRVALDDGREYSLLVETGDHGRYPVSYSEGTWPVGEDEIALSVLNASELGLGVGDVVTVRTGRNGSEGRIRCRVCGIYSDITNGGKTAKACFAQPEDADAPMWCVVYATLTESDGVAEWVERYQAHVHDYDAGMRVTDISNYVNAIYGQTIRHIQAAALLAAAVSGFVLATVVLLFVRLAVWQERSSISLQKALGFVSAEIRLSYLRQLLPYVLGGTAAGVYLGLGPGQHLAGLLLGSLGASGFQFIIDPVQVFLVTPLTTVVVAMLAARFSLAEINRIRASECCAGRE